MPDTAPTPPPGPWRYLLLTKWGDISGSNSRDDVDVALLHWAGAQVIDTHDGVMLGNDPQPVELLDVSRYRSLPPPGR